jgi:hypothetical protein
LGNDDVNWYPSTPFDDRHPWVIHLVPWSHIQCLDVQKMKEHMIAAGVADVVDGGDAVVLVDVGGAG